ncbi:MAG: hypothetical protein MHPSP_000249, partial [Paramarteilia canceri]
MKNGISTLFSKKVALSMKKVVEKIVQKCKEEGYSDVNEQLVTFIMKALILDPKNSYALEKNISNLESFTIADECLKKVQSDSFSLNTIKIQVKYDTWIASQSEQIANTNYAYEVGEIKANAMLNKIWNLVFPDQKNSSNLNRSQYESVYESIIKAIQKMHNYNENSTIYSAKMIFPVTSIAKFLKKYENLPNERNKKIYEASLITLGHTVCENFLKNEKIFSEKSTKDDAINLFNDSSSKLQAKIMGELEFLNSVQKKLNDHSDVFDLKVRNYTEFICFEKSQSLIKFSKKRVNSLNTSKTDAINQFKDLKDKNSAKVQNILKKIGRIEQMIIFESMRINEINKFLQDILKYRKITDSLKFEEKKDNKREHPYFNIENKNEKFSLNKIELISIKFEEINFIREFNGYCLGELSKDECNLYRPESDSFYQILAYKDKNYLLSSIGHIDEFAENPE